MQRRCISHKRKKSETTAPLLCQGQDWTCMNTFVKTALLMRTWPTELRKTNTLLWDIYLIITGIKTN